MIHRGCFTAMITDEEGAGPAMLASGRKRSREADNRRARMYLREIDVVSCEISIAEQSRSRILVDFGLSHTAKKMTWTYRALGGGGRTGGILIYTFPL